MKKTILMEQISAFHEREAPPQVHSLQLLVAEFPTVNYFRVTLTKNQGKCNLFIVIILFKMPLLKSWYLLLTSEGTWVLIQHQFTVALVKASKGSSLAAPLSLAV